MIKKGFTLAEVLITLGIIGVVAAMTMPVLIASYQKKQAVTQLKKVYSAMQQSIQMSQVQYGDISDWEWSLNAKDFFDTYIASNLVVAKYCGTKNGCWNTVGGYTLKGDIDSDSPSLNKRWYTLMLSDGVFIALEKQDNAHIHLKIDINGEKRPNTNGKDIFIMTLTSKALNDGVHNVDKPGLYMYGQGLTRDELTASYYGCARNRVGYHCGAILLMDGWEMKEDYPW